MVLKIEPKYYLPIIPMALINGCQGIGTGYSTNIPSFNPLDIVHSIANLLVGKQLPDIVPYFHGFKGTFVVRKKGNGYISKGKYKLVNKSTVMITELPIGTWTSDYKEFLDSLVMDYPQRRGGISAQRRKHATKQKSKRSPSKKNKDKQILLSYENHSTESTIKFILRFPPMSLYKIMKKGNKTVEDISELERLLKLTSTKSTNLSNIHMFDENGRIRKFTNINDIVTHFYGLRLELYVKRREYLIRSLQRDYDIIKSKVRFVKEFIANIIEIRNKKKQDLLDLLKNRKYPMFDLSHNSSDPLYSPGYDYLIRMPIYSLTLERKEELIEQRDIKQAELQSIIEKVPKQLWKDDLYKFVKAYKKQYGVVKKVRRKKISIKKSK